MVNNHGLAFLEFLYETKMCVLNGRFNSKNDGPTSVSSKGVAVVDYIVCPIDCIQMFDNFTVETCIDVINAHSLNGMLNKQCKVPDHAIVSAQFNVSVNHYSVENVENNCYKDTAQKTFPNIELHHDDDDAVFTLDFIQQNLKLRVAD